MLPGYSPDRAVIFHTDRAFLVAHRFLVYPTGVELTLTLKLREPRDRDGLPWELHGRVRPPDPLPDDFLRIGILFPDGAKWTNLHSSPPRRFGPPDPPVIMPRGGGGGGDSYDMEYWMWPLPPDGPLTVVAEWPAYGIGETRTVIDGSALRQAAGDAQVLWPD